MQKCAMGLLALAAILAHSTHSSAQVLYVEAGPTIPTSDYGKYAKGGFMGIAGLEIPVGTSGLQLYGEGFVGRNTHDVELYDASTMPLGVMAGGLFNFTPDEAGGPYAFAGVGYMIHKYSSDEFGDDSQKAIAFQGGAGYAFPFGGVEAFLEGRLMTASFDGDSEGSDSEATRFVGLFAGIAIPLGGEG